MGTHAMSPLLLDTSATIWAAEDGLAPQAIGMLSERYRRGEAVYVSPITAWEFGMLFSRGRLRAAVSPMAYWRRIASAEGVRLAAMPAEVLMAASDLPGDILTDLANRIVAATAREYGFTVMTRDRRILAFAREVYLNAVEC
jgi:PIN domain nuclease of toxin-antitoxin system